MCKIITWDSSEKYRLPGLEPRDCETVGAERDLEFVY